MFRGFDGYLAKIFFSKNPFKKPSIEDRINNDFQLQILLNRYAK